MTTIRKPLKTVVPLAAGLAWPDAGNFREGGIFQQKLDGCFGLSEWPGGILAGEIMIGGNFIAFDCVQWQGQDVRGIPLRDRLQLRGEICAAHGIPIVAETIGNGGEFLRAILDAGGEGAVFKRLDALYGEPMLACKRVQDFICRVVGQNAGKQSVRICDPASGQPMGNLSLFGGKSDRVRPGSLVKVRGMGLTARGIIREPRPDADSHDSWLLSF